MVLIQSFETRHTNPSAGALFAWAASTMESLHYLDDIDRVYDTSHTVVGAHHADVVDVAHARWATSTCITALDLCAAGLGRSFCAHSGPRERDLACFDSNQPSKRQAAWQARRSGRRLYCELCILVRGWLFRQGIGAQAAAAPVVSGD